MKHHTGLPSRGAPFDAALRDTPSDIGRWSRGDGKPPLDGHLPSILGKPWMERIGTSHGALGALGDPGRTVRCDGHLIDEDAATL